MLEKLLFPLRQGISRLALVGLLAFGCGAEQDYDPCTSNNDCSQGRVCLQGECVEPPDCGNGQCEAYKQEDCLTCATDCGKCKELCDICSSDEECWNGQGDNRCIKDLTEIFSYNNKGVCGKNCSTDADCSLGYECKNIDLSEGNVRQCYSTDKVWKSLPVCLTDQVNPDCENNWGESLPCQGTRFSKCGTDDTAGRVLSIDCADFGLMCYDKILSNGSHFIACYGKGQPGEPCDDDFDCDPTLVDNDCQGYFPMNSSTQKNACLPYDCKDSYGCPKGFYCEYGAYGGEGSCKGEQINCSLDSDCLYLGENFYCNRNDSEEKHNFCTKYTPGKCNLDTGCPPQYNCDNGSCSMFSFCTGDQECKDYGYTKCVGSDPHHKKCV